VRLADVVVSKLLEFGIEEAFIVTGRGSLFLTDAVARDPRIHSVSMHHEQSAGYAAAAAAATTKRPSSCILSTGVGSTNAISAVLSAWQDEVPVFFISGQNYSKSSTSLTFETIRSYGEQEANIEKIVKSITNFSTTLDDPASIVSVLDTAFEAAMGPRKGPVWIDIPLDFQSARVAINSSSLNSGSIKTSKPRQGLRHDLHSNNEVTSPLTEVREQLNLSERPLILLGGGAGWVDKEDLGNFLFRLNVPVTFESGAATSISLLNPLVIGSVGSLGCSRAGNFALQNADLVIMLGSQLRASLTGDSTSIFAPNAKLVLVDVDDTQVRKEIKHRVSLVPTGVESFIQEFERGSTITDSQLLWIDKCVHWKETLPRFIGTGAATPIDLYDLADIIGKVSPSNSVFTTDSGFIELIIPTNAILLEGQDIIHPHSQGAMGFALPASVGAQVATGRPVVVIVGDGSIMMNIQELETIANLKTNIKILIVSNNAYAIIRRRQEELFRNRTIGTDTSNGVTVPDFKKVASAFGLDYLHIGDLGPSNQLAVKKFLESARPGILEIKGLPNQDYIRQASRVVSGGSFEIRPLNDLAPFLDEEYIDSEMIT
jgi:acetolactate synthase-1/2/3 large subunit